jgi:hypothetical protein
MLVNTPTAVGQLVDDRHKCGCLWRYLVVARKTCPPEQWKIEPVRKIEGCPEHPMDVEIGV